MRRAVVLAALLAALPAHAADCEDVIAEAAYKRMVADVCGYFVNTGEVEAREKACRKQIGSRDLGDGQHTARLAFVIDVKAMGLLKACRSAFDRHPGAFVAD